MLIYTAHPVSDVEARELFEIRGFKISEWELDNHSFLCLEFDFPCPHLDKDRGCLIYDKRPAICRKFPVTELDVNDMCKKSFNKEGDK